MVLGVHLDGEVWIALVVLGVLGGFFGMFSVVLCATILSKTS